MDGSASSDPDGVITSWSWDFGDGQGGSGESIPHTYGAAGPYAVSLTVTDDEGATDQLTRTVNVAGAAPRPPSEFVPVPLLGHWQLMLLALLLGVSGVLYLRRSG